MPTCDEFATTRLANRPIKEQTHKEYMASLRVLGLASLDVEEVTVALVTSRLNRVLNQGTRRKHAINVRAALGVHVRCPRPVQKVYDLPALDVLHAALEASPYRHFGFAMLYAGLRVGESCTKQPLKGNVLMVDRQKLPDGTVAVAKTTGPVFIPEWLVPLYQAADFDRCANTVYVGIRRAGKKAGLDLNPHQLRHAFATNLVKNGATPEVLRRQMRHHDVSVSLRYYVQTTDQDVSDVVNLFQNPATRG